jgi:predicted transcriptional regulator
MHGHRPTDSISVSVAKLTSEELSRADIRCRIFEFERIKRRHRGGLRRQQRLANSGPALADSIRACGTGEACERVRNFRPAGRKKEPAVSIRKSITPDYLVCLDDGKKFKSLRRHLGTLGLTPDEYRAKWSLSADYPMVAPNYAAQRSELAKQIGLGQMRKNAATAEPTKRERPAKAGK